MSSSIVNNNSGVSISVSDDDSDELGRIRLRVPRKRKKHGRVRTELNQRIIRWLVKYWTLLIFLLAAGLLLFEASRIGGKPSLVVNTELSSLKRTNLLGNSELQKVKKTSDKRNLESNLNRLDPPRKCLLNSNF